MSFLNDKSEEILKNNKSYKQTRAPEWMLEILISKSTISKKLNNNNKMINDSRHT